MNAWMNFSALHRCDDTAYDAFIPLRPSKVRAYTCNSKISYFAYTPIVQLEYSFYNKGSVEHRNRALMVPG